MSPKGQPLHDHRFDRGGKLVRYFKNLTPAQLTELARRICLVQFETADIDPERIRTALMEFAASTPADKDLK